MLLVLLLLPFFQATSQAITFAQLALGGGYEAVLIVTNKTGFGWIGTIFVSQGYNQKWQGRWAINSQDLTGRDGMPVFIPPRGSVKLRFTGDAVTRSGYLELDSDLDYSDLDVAVSYFYEYRSAGWLQDTVGSPESAWDDKFVFAVEKSLTIDTGFAWCPSSRYSSRPFQVTLTLRDQNGNIARQRTVTFNGHQAQFFTQIFTDLPAFFLGHLLLESEEYMHLEVLRLEQTAGGFQLTSTPADDYVP
jgi:hypothetical protein